MSTKTRQEVNKILNDFAINALQQLQPIAKGFAPSLAYEISEQENSTELKITGHRYILTLIYGRGPTKEGATKGNPTLRETILEWVRKHSITMQDEKSGKALKDEVVAFLIAKKIHREGTLLYRNIQKGQKPINIFDDVIGRDKIDKLKKDITTDFISLISYKIFEL